MNSRNVLQSSIIRNTGARAGQGWTAHPFSAVMLALALFLTLLSTGLYAQCELACKHYAPIALDAAGMHTVTEADVLNNWPDPACPGMISIILTTAQGVPVSNTLHCDQIGDTLTVTATHLGSGNSCWGSIIIVDNLPPMLSCPQDTFVWCADSLLPTSTGYPAWTENCSDLDLDDLVYSDVFTNQPCSTMVNSYTITGWYARTWELEDASGNVANCQQMIYLRTATIEDVDLPVDRDGFAAPKLDCSVNVKDLSVTGQPTIDGFPLNSFGHCDWVVDTFDLVIPGCIGGSYTTRRTWRLIDFCQDTTYFHTQVIELADTTAPVITAPADITIGTSAQTCDAFVMLPGNWTASDDCSTFNVTAHWQFGSGFGPYQKVPQGSYPVEYRAQDACGNIGRDTLMVHIIDDKKPTAVCKKDVNIALPSSGIITVPASLFDDGSYDNCELDYLHVSRDNGPFGPFITFNCNDIPNNVMVILQAVDKAGLSNTCMMIVLVQDKLPPIMQCPGDITVACNADEKNLSVMGYATAIDNCQIKSITYTDTKFLNPCQVGYINRLWTAEDVYGNKAGCLQVITKVDQTPISIIWPGNFQSEQCGQDTSPSVTGEPVISGKDCENLFVFYEDKIFQSVFPACYRIERCWTVKEWCSYNPNQQPNPGEWIHVQYIDIYDKEAPELILPPDVTIGTNDLNCMATVQLPSAIAIDCNPNTFITNNSPYAQSGGASVNGQYPLGVHEIMFTAFDGCGNNAMASMRITVVDDKPPLAVCNKGITVGLNMNGFALLPVTIVDNNSQDNCTPYHQLSFSVSPNTFNCDSLGERIVKLTVTDQVGNSNFCTTIVHIQDNLGICPGGGGAKPEVGGTILGLKGDPASGVEVWSNGVDVAETNQAGKYQFKDLQKNMNYTFAPEYDKDPSKGITVSDIIAIQRHISGIKSINDPFLLIAADVNNSGSVTISDIIELRRLLLGKQSAFQHMPSWVFVESSYVFKNPLKPWQEPYPQEIVIPNIQGAWLNQDFVAVKIGDVNASAVLNGLWDADPRSWTGAELWVEDPWLEAGHTYRIPVTVKSTEALIGMQWQLTLPSSAGRFKTFEQAGWATFSPDMIHLEEEQTRLVWHSQQPDPGLGQAPMMFLIIEAASAGYLSQFLELGSALPAEAVDTDGDESGIALHFERNVAEVAGSRIDPVWPNPSRGEVQAAFHLDEAATVAMQVVNALGVPVWTWQADYGQGSYQITIPAEKLRGRGAYHLRMQINGQVTGQQTFMVIDE